MTVGGRDAVLIDAVRSPVGRCAVDGSLSGIHPVDLLSQVLIGLLDRADVDPVEVEDVVTGCAAPSDGGISVIGRSSWIAARLPAHVPSTTIDRAGGASAQAVHFACQGIMAGAYDVVVAAGIESPSLAGYAPRVTAQTIAAERLAQRCDIGREAMDAYAQRSHQRAREVALAGEFCREITPISLSAPTGAEWISSDETMSSATTIDLLRRLPPICDGSPIRDRHPDLSWQVTEGNSAPAGEAATAMLIMSARRAKQLGHKPRARFASLAVAADDANQVVPGPVTATDLALKRAGISVDQLDHAEINETYAVVPLAWEAAVGINPEFLNPRGGAIALGNPRGASSARMMTTMLTALEDTGGRFGLQAEWVADGSVNATILERL